MQYCTRNPAIKKPELSDASSIIDINDNMDVIDGIICKSNYNGGIDPGVNDDIGDGYSVGSHWWNVIDHRLFVAESVATGAAVWRQIYPTIDALMPDGSVPLSANWDAGAYEIRAQTFESDQATGTAPLVVASTTKVTNLNADKLDGLDDTAFLKHSLATAANDFLVASGAGAFAKKTLAETQAILGCRLTGWIDAPALTFSAADAPVYTVTCNGNYTLIIPVGARIALTHSGATKYFIVVKTSYSSPNTTFTLYGGTDYTLAAGAITNPYYSIAKAPVGFPLDPDKWTVMVTDSSDRSQSNPSNSTYYNVGSIQISIPIGAWRIHYNVFASTEVVSAPAYLNFTVCLSTTNNGNTLASLSRFVATPLINSQLNGVCSGEPYTVASKTTLYLNASTNSNQACATTHFHNNWSTLIIKAICAYL